MPVSSIELRMTNAGPSVHRFPVIDQRNLPENWNPRAVTFADARERIISESTPTGTNVEKIGDLHETALNQKDLVGNHTTAAIRIQARALLFRRDEFFLMASYEFVQS
jgi:hypothetical protein